MKNIKMVSIGKHGYCLIDNETGEVLMTFDIRGYETWRIGK